MTFKYEIFIPFHLADPAGILFFGHFFSLAHQAYEQYVIEKIGFSWQEWFQNQEWIVPIRQTEAEFFHPIMAGLACQIETQIERMSTSSIQISYQFYQENIKCGRLKSVHIFCCRHSMKKISIPASVTGKISKEIP